MKQGKTIFVIAFATHGSGQYWDCCQCKQGENDNKYDMCFSNVPEEAIVRKQVNPTLVFLEHNVPDEITVAKKVKVFTLQENDKFIKEECTYNEVAHSDYANPPPPDLNATIPQKRYNKAELFELDVLMNCYVK